MVPLNVATCATISIKPGFETLDLVISFVKSSEELPFDSIFFITITSPPDSPVNNFLRRSSISLISIPSFNLLRPAITTPTDFVNTSILSAIPPILRALLRISLTSTLPKALMVFAYSTISGANLLVKSFNFTISSKICERLFELGIPVV